MAHPDDELLDQYATGRLGDERLAEVEEHLLVCSICQARIAELDEFLSTFRLASPRVSAQAASLWSISPHRFLFWAAPVSATAALLFTIGFRPSSP